MNNLKPNVLHFRPLPVNEGDTEPTGGVSVAYYLREHQGNVVAVCGISLCSFQDNFNRKVGRNRAVGRLMSALDYPVELHKNLGMIQYLSLGSISEIQEATKDSIGLQKFSEAIAVGGKGQGGPVVTTVPYDGTEGAYLFLREEDWPSLEAMKESIIGNLIEYRQSAYEGDDELILDDISEMFVDYIGDDQVDDDEDEDDLEDEESEFKLP